MAMLILQWTLVGLVAGGIGGIVMARIMEGPTDRYLTDWEVQEILDSEK